MSIFQFPSKQAKKQAMEDAVIELAFAGSVVAGYLLFSHGSMVNCVCGAITPDPNNPANHHRYCPVARYYAAVEAVRKASADGKARA